MDGHRNAHDSPVPSVDVMASVDSEELPAVALKQRGESLAGNGFDLLVPPSRTLPD